MMVHELNQRLGNMFHGPFERGQSIVFGFLLARHKALPSVSRKILLSDPE